MDVLESKIDAASEEFRRRRESMESLVAGLREETEKTRRGCGPRYEKRHREHGKLLVRELIETLRQGLGIGPTGTSISAGSRRASASRKATRKSCGSFARRPAAPGRRRLARPG